MYMMEATGAYIGQMTVVTWTGERRRTDRKPAFPQIGSLEVWGEF
jgi:hypothetical protein